MVAKVIGSIAVLTACSGFGFYCAGEMTRRLKQLRELSDAPYGIFYRGSLPVPEQFRVAIVGARMCSEYGRTIAREIARELALHDVAVVSGMARGIDAAGHRGALDSGGDTYAVFGCGVDVCYPDYHRQLYHEILKHGGLLSEYPPGTKPFPGYFPQRNRLISVLSDVVLIIEAKQKSGSLITADFALEQGRDVYALPGRVTDALSYGCNELIRQGGGIVTSTEGLLLDLGFSSRKKGEKEEIAKKSLEKEELLVYSCFDLYPRNLEELVKLTKISVPNLADVLIKLQTKGLIEEYFKNHYRKK